MKKKTILFLTTFLIIVLVLIFSSVFYINTQGPEKIRFVKNLLPNNLKFLIKEQVCQYQYFVPEYSNERMFPKTQFLKLNYNEIEIKGLESQERYSEEILRYGHPILPESPSD